MTHLPQAADTWLAEHQNTLIDEVMHTISTTKRRLVLNLIERTPFEANHIRTDFHDFCFSIILSEEPVGVKTLAIKLTYA